MVGVTECIGEKVVQSIELFFGVRIQENYAVTGAGNRNQTRARSKPGGRTEKLKHNTRPSASNIYCTGITKSSTTVLMSTGTNTELYRTVAF